MAAFALLVALALSALPGCSLAGSEPEYDTATDFDDRFDILIPQGWRSVSDSSILAIYAAEDLPTEEESLEILSVLVISAPARAEVTPERMLEEYVEFRAEDRGWQNAEISEVTSAALGGREGHAIDVTATDENGHEFQAKFVTVRTGGTDFVMIAVTPADEYDEYAADVDGIMERWSWRVPDESGEATGGAEPVE
jgi:hypothetical protein